MRVKRIALENHGDVAARRRNIADGPGSDSDFAVGGIVETGEQSQQGAFAAPRGTDKHQKLAIDDRQIQLTNYLNGISAAASWEGLAEVFETDAGQRQSCSG